MKDLVLAAQNLLDRLYADDAKMTVQMMELQQLLDSDFIKDMTG
jgi:hypothetical protein